MYILGYSGFTRDSHLARGIRNPLAKTNQNFSSIFNYDEGEVPFTRFPLGYFGHDASAALYYNGKLIAASAEERFTRVKYSLNLLGNTLLPKNSINFCLNKAGISIKDLDVVAHYCDFNEKSIKKRIELLEPWLLKDEKKYLEESYWNIFSSMLSHEVVRRQFEEMTGLMPDNFLHVPHHETHAFSAFYPSGFNEALIVTIDGTGETESSLIAIGKKGKIAGVERTLIPTSLGSLYLIITVYLGFRSLGDEYKVMGLASYGNADTYRSFFNSLVALKENGNYSTELLASANLCKIIIEYLGRPRIASEKFTQRHADIAAALQESLNNAVLHKLKYLRKETGLKNLCLAGGVVLNCTMNGVIASSGLFDNIFVQPAANDEGCSVGAALYAYKKFKSEISISCEKWDHVYLGPDYSDNNILTEINNFSEKIIWRKPENISMYIAQKLSEGFVIGWFQGRMEFGPRALGNRSILADPRDAKMKDRINKKVKRRESFRPFAPAVLEEDADKFFNMSGLANSPYMLFALEVNNNSIPAVTHVDNSGRIQTVSKKTNPLFWKLLYEFKAITGIGVLLNTSFNVRNEPIVCSPKDAINCYLNTDIDYLAMGSYFIEKNKE